MNKIIVVYEREDCCNNMAVVESLQIFPYRRQCLWWYYEQYLPELDGYPENGETHNLDDIKNFQDYYNLYYEIYQLPDDEADIFYKKCLATGPLDKRDIIEYLNTLDEYHICNEIEYAAYGKKHSLRPVCKEKYCFMGQCGDRKYAGGML